MSAAAPSPSSSSVPATATASGQPFRLGLRRVYILPTRHGVMLFVVILAILIGAINYSNALAYVLAFLLLSLSAVSMLHTWRNLYGLRLESGRCAPVFAGDTARPTVILQIPQHDARRAIRLSYWRQAAVTVDLEQSAQTVQVPCAAPRRGRLQPGPLTVATSYPLGLFRAWFTLRPAQSCLVYPTPAGRLPLPLPRALAESQAAVQTAAPLPGDSDFADLRPYRPGDALQQIHWKSAAREQGLHVKRFTDAGRQRLWLDWELLPELETEARLSQLCRWVLQADAAGLEYGLNLPGVQIVPARGTPHSTRCLQALALHGVPA